MSRDDHNNEKKIIVTGAGGFLGSNLVDVLVRKEEYCVYALSSQRHQLQQTNTMENIQYRHKDDIFSEKGEQILNDAVVVNCAFPRNTSGIELADGLRYIQRLFDKSVECGAKAVINISSQSVYSQTRENIATEATPIFLASPYAVGKYATELMLESACKRTGMPYTNLRMASLIGPGFSQRIVNRLVKQAIEGKKLQAVRNNQKYGFLDIEDAVRALIILLDTDAKQWKPVYNIGNGKEYSVEYIAWRIKHVFEQNGLSIPNTTVEMGNGSGSTGVAFGALHEDTGFEPSINLDISIQRILEQLREDDQLN